MEKIYIYAKPSATNVVPYYVSFATGSLSSMGTYTENLVIVGKSFFDIRNVYVSGSDISLFSEIGCSLFNPFSAMPRLSASNPSFSAYVISEFTIIGDSVLTFPIPEKITTYISSKEPPYESFLDVIVENEAGYGLLTRDSYRYSVSSWSGFEQHQLPCVSGIKLVSY